MSVSRSRTLYLIALLALIVCSLRPEGHVDAAVDFLFAPAEALGVLAAPMRWLSAGAVRAAESDVETSAQSEMDASRALVAAERSSARPTEKSLSSDRGFVLAEVVEYVDKHRDEVSIAYNSRASLAPGMPVVCGDAYVGRVKSLCAGKPGCAIVALVTGSSFRVGALVECDGESGAARTSELVVGGLANRRASGEGLRLAAQFRSDRTIDHGLVRVDESDALEAEPCRKLANGYVLGDLAPSASPDEPPSVEPRLDYNGGLSEVAVVYPDPSIDGGVFARDPFDGAAWIDVPLVVHGTASCWRAGAELAAGTSRGIAERAALAIGPRLVGRVAHAEWRRSDAILLGDPGFQVNVTAAVEGVEHPLSLGRLTSLGVDRATGEIVWRAEVAWPGAKIESASPRRATLFTAAGDLGIPAGLWIGTADIPAEARSDRWRLRVRAPQALQPLAEVAAWRATPGPASGGTAP